MRSLVIAFSGMVLAATLHAQAPSSPFLAQLANLPIASAVHKSIVIGGSANWVVGSTHETGTAQLEADVDGSYQALLGLSTATRADYGTALASARTCTWMDGNGGTHSVTGGNCWQPVPWFSPFMAIFCMAQTTYAVSDNGMVQDGGSARHSVTFHVAGQGAPAYVQLLANASSVSVFFDPNTLLPLAMTYSLHPDGNDTLSIPVRVEFSDFRTVSGISLPYHIDRYINRTLQLSIQATTVTLQ